MFLLVLLSYVFASKIASFIVLIPQIREMTAVAVQLKYYAPEFWLHVHNHALLLSLCFSSRIPIKIRLF